MYHERIRFLEESLRHVDQQLTTAEGENRTALVEQRHRVLSELNRFRKLQFEEDHERVHFDDDDR